MLQMILLAAMSLLVILVCLAVLGWLIFVGPIGSMDSILLSAICIVVGVIFVVNLTWVVRDGGLLGLLRTRRLKGHVQEKQEMDQGSPKQG